MFSVLHWQYKGQFRRDCMVLPTGDTFDTLFSKFEKEFDYMIPAEALFWKRAPGHGAEYGLRVEAPDIMKEFINNVNLGRDPKGFLFYDDIKDFDGQDAERKYDVYYNTTDDTKQRAAVVEFYVDKKSGAYAIFLCRDKNKAVDYTLEGQSGKWVDVTAASASAFVKKLSRSTTVNVEIPSIKKKATFDAPQIYANSPKVSVDVRGNLTFKQLTALDGSASYVDYNSDRLVFYPTSGYAGSADFTAFFIPLESADVKALGDMSFEASNVVWSNYEPKN